MAKSRFDEGVELDENGENKTSSAQFLNFSGDNVVLISQIPITADINELEEYLGKYLWIEEPNGIETRQALIILSSIEAYENIISQTQLYFSDSFILIEKCSNLLQDISKKHFELINEQNKDEQRIKTQQFYKSGIINYIGEVLSNINKERQDVKDQNGNFPDISANSLLLTKFSCNIILCFIAHIPTIIEEIEKIKIPTQLIMIISSLTTHDVTFFHMELLNKITKVGSQQLRKEMNKTRNVLNLVRFLNHSNELIRICSMNIIYNIMHIDKDRQDLRNNHPQYLKMKNNGTINIISQIIRREFSDEMKNKAAFVVGTLMSKQILEPELKRELIQQLKSGIENCIREVIIERLNVLCGLALQEQNNSEIASDKFIEKLVEFSNSTNNDIKSYALELLLIIVENSGSEIELKIRNSIDNMKFLELIGDLNYGYFDERVVNLTLNWTNSEHIKSIKELNSIVQKYNNSILQKKNEILNEQLIPIILSLLNFVNEQLSQKEQKDIKIPLEILGAINLCCSIIEDITCDKEVITIINKTTIQQELIILLKNLPASQTKSIHINSFFNLIEDLKSPLQMSKLYQLGIIQTFTRFLINYQTSYIVNVKNVIICFINIGLLFKSSIQQFSLKMHFQSQHLFFDDLLKDGTINIFQQITNSQNNNIEISKVINNCLILLYNGHHFPINYLDQALILLKKEIEDDIINKNQNLQALQSLQILSFNQENHEIILKSGTLQYLIQIISQFQTKQQQLLIKIFSYLYERGNIIVKNHIKEILPINTIERLINRQKLGLIYYSSDYNEDIIQNNLNLEIFRFISYQKEEIIMNQVIAIKNNVIQYCYQLQEKYDQMNNNLINSENIRLLLDNKEQIIVYNDEYIKKNLCVQIKIMAIIVNEIQDKELAYGAMIAVREVIYIIMFDLIKRWEEENISYILDKLQDIVNNSDDKMLVNLFDIDTFKCIRFIIEECKQSKNQLQLKLKVLIFTVNVLQRSAQMGYDIEYNHLNYALIKSHLPVLIKQILENETQLVEINEEIKYLNDNINLQLAIAYCCIIKGYCIDEKLLKIIGTILINKLTSFINLIKQQQQSINSQNQNHHIKKNNCDIRIEIDNKDIQLIQKIIFSLGILGSAEVHVNILINQLKIFDILLPLIHINCNCPSTISLSDKNSYTQLISTIFISLKFIVNNSTQEQINKQNSEYNLIDHIIPYILNNSNLINSNRIKLSSLQYNHNNNNNAVNLISHQQRNNAFHLFFAMTDSNLIAKQFLLDSNFNKFLKQYIQSRQIYNEIKKKSPNDSNNFLEAIQMLLVTVPEKMIEKVYIKYNILKLLLIIIGCAGGNGSDYDEILSISLNQFKGKIQKFLNIPQMNHSKQRSNQVIQLFEEEGFYEEQNALNFHSDIRENIGVKLYANEINSLIIWKIGV